LEASLTFRPLARSDYPALARWLAAPHVAIWWNETADPDHLETKYGPRIDGFEATHVFFIEHEGRPIGWIQWYLWADHPTHAAQLEADQDAAGIDLAIGELDRVGAGLGPIAIRMFLRQIVFANPRVAGVVVDPEEGNLRSLRAFEKTGFRFHKTVRLTGELCQRSVLRLDRID
jgi:aminoglycoside 6'-N-acetyltransferase